MIIGTFGDLIFEASSEKVFTISNISRSSAKRTADFTPVRGKKVRQYLGSEIRSVSASLTLNAFLGVKPREALDQLIELAESDEAYPLIINGSPLSDNPFCLMSTAEEWKTILSEGELFSAEVKLTWEEYV